MLAIVTLIQYNVFGGSGGLKRRGSQTKCSTVANQRTEVISNIIMLVDRIAHTAPL